MKKNILFLVLLTNIFAACEKDDFCVKNPVTSKLIIDFYDNTNRETLKKVQGFSVIAEGKTDSLFTNQSFNSISIPLNSLTTETSYIFKKIQPVAPLPIIIWQHFLLYTIPRKHLFLDLADLKLFLKM